MTDDEGDFVEIDFALLDEALGRITPDNHDPRHWHRVANPNRDCGTTMCLAGHIAVCAGATLPTEGNPWLVDACTGVFVESSLVDRDELDDNSVHVSLFARDSARLTWWQADVLFHASNTLEGIRAGVEALRADPSISREDLGDTVASLRIYS